MSAGDLISLPWQVELNELLMGPETDFVVRHLDLWAPPEVRQAEQARAQAHGMSPGRDWFGSRLVAAEFYVIGDTDAIEAVNRQTLTGAWQPPSDTSAVPLVWMEDDGIKYRLYGKPRLASPRVEPRIPTECRFVATDPLIYSNVESSASTGLSTAVGGLSFPATAPFVFGSAGTGNTMSCPNDGNTATSWVATFTGPLIAPELVHVGSGKRISLTGASLAAGETLVVDSGPGKHTVLYMGTTSRYSWLAAASQWFDLEPGANSVTLLGASGAGSVSIAWRSAWI